jgi:magnesium transporter
MEENEVVDDFRADRTALLSNDRSQLNSVEGGNPAAGKTQREILTYVFNSSGEGTLVPTNLRELLNEINAEVTLEDLNLDNPSSTSTGLDTERQVLSPLVHPGSGAVIQNLKEQQKAMRRGSSILRINPLQHDVHVGSPNEIVNSYVSKLRLRDLRRLDFNFNPNDEKSFLIRRNVVLFALDPIRAVIMSNKLILFLPDGGADAIIQLLGNNLRADKADRDTANEMHAYDALLKSLIDFEREKYKDIKHQITSTLQLFKGAALLSIDIQEEMRLLKNNLSQLTSNLESTRTVLQHLTEDDKEMALMNLSILKSKPSLYKLPLSPEILATHDRSEELLETHLIDLNALCSQIGIIRSHMQNAEDSVLLRLDTSRNELLIANTALTLLSVGIAFGAYITGVFGMNLDQTTYLQPKKNSFVIVTMLTFVIIFLIFLLGYGYLKVAGIIPERVKLTKPSSTRAPRGTLAFIAPPARQGYEVSRTRVPSIG